MVAEQYDIHAPPQVIQRLLEDSPPRHDREWRRAQQRIRDHWPEIAERLRQQNWETISWALYSYHGDIKDVTLLGYRYGKRVGVDIRELLGPDPSDGR